MSIDSSSQPRRQTPDTYASVEPMDCEFRVPKQALRTFRGNSLLSTSARGLGSDSLHTDTDICVNLGCDPSRVNPEFDSLRPVPFTITQIRLELSPISLHVRLPTKHPLLSCKGLLALFLYSFFSSVTTTPLELRVQLGIQAWAAGASLVLGAQKLKVQR